jgi:protease IV
MDADHAVDRRRLKRRLIVWQVAAIVAVVGFVVAAFGGFTDITRGDYVARVFVDNLILDDPDRDRSLARIADDPRVKALVVRIDSPGGTVVGGETLYESLRTIAEKKPVVAVMGEVATSAAYMTALGADRIFARPGSLTGSIGVILQTADMTGLLERIGIKPELVKSRPLKAQPNPFETFTPEAREVTRQVVLDLFDLFVDMVADRRGMSREAVLVLADGRVFSGRQALANGLVDALGGETAARRWLAEERGIDADLRTRDVETDEDEPVWRRMLEGTIGKTLLSERLNLDGLVSLWHPDLM